MLIKRQPNNELDATLVVVEVEDTEADHQEMEEHIGEVVETVVPDVRTNLDVEIMNEEIEVVVVVVEDVEANNKDNTEPTHIVFETTRKERFSSEEMLCKWTDEI